VESEAKFGGRMSELPIWVSWLQALAVPAIAFAGVLVAVSGHLLARKQRSDQLFDKRYDFYRSLIAAIEAPQTIRPGSVIAPMDGTSPTLDRFAEEAEFLFDDDVARHIRNFRPKSWTIGSTVPPEFVLPFKSYLRVR
jgi:hypothetical protein